MKNLFCILVVIALGFTRSAFAQDAPAHPRLLFGPADIPALRAKIQNEPFKSMFERLKADAVKDQWGTWPLPQPPGLYDETTNLQRNAFLYVLTGDDAWAKKARELTAARIHDTKTAPWASPKLKGLTSFMQASRVALAYDWCYGAPSWDAAFSATVSGKLKEMADMIHTNGGTEQNRDPASNWQGARFATAGLCYLASDEAFDQKNLETDYGRVVRYLSENLGTNKSSRGWNIEGLGYTFFPMGNYVGPFGIAMARHDAKKDLRQIFPAARWTYWTIYAATTPAMGGIRPDFSDDNPGTSGEGTYGQAFYYADPQLLPGLRFAYDRLWGTQGDRSFDPARAGTIYSILFYPADVTEQDPITMPQWREGFMDAGGNGFFTYRNRYLDKDDMVAQMYLKLRGNKGHNGPDALSFRILGLDTAWAVGGGRYGPKINGQDAYLRSMNTLYPVDPDEKLTTNGNSGKLIGTPQSKADGGGHLVSSIEQNNVGVKNHKRRFVADYSATSGAEAVYVISDTSDDGKYWQICTLDTNPITTEGNTFTITGADGATLRGTVLYQAGDIAWKTGKRIRGSDFKGQKENNFAHLQSVDGDFLIVLTVARAGKAHPPVSANGLWSGPDPQGTVKIGGLTVSIKGDDISY